MNIVLITQADPFYLSKNIEYLVNNLPSPARITGCVLSDVSPFGRQEGFFTKALKTLEIFGFRFFVHYSLRYLKAMFSSQSNVKNVLLRHNIPIIFLSGSINSESSLNAILEKSPDLLLSIGGNQIFKKPLIELAKLGCLNLHTAPLPKYRGLMPSFWVLKNQEPRTAVSVFYVDEGIDSGPILVQKKIELSGQSQDELIRQTKKIGMDCIVKAVEKILAGDTATIPNDDEYMTYYSFPTKRDVKEFRRVGARFF